MYYLKECRVIVLIPIESLNTSVPFLAPPSGVSLPELHRLLVPATLFELLNAAQKKDY